MQKIKTIIVDDEPLAINVLQEYIQKVSFIDLVQSFPNAVNAANYLQENEVDLILLDVNMPVLDGFDFLESLHTKPLVIITSAHEQYALKGYEFEALDYLVKPIPFPRFLKAVNRVANIKGKDVGNKQNIFVKIDNKRLQKIYIDEILVIESLKDYIRIKTTSNKYTVHKTLTGFTEELPKEKFIRIHRSYTVAKDKIESIEGNSVTVDGIRYTIGRSYIDEAKQRILDQ